MDLANEIIESIVVLLDLSDICNLRLAGRLIALKVTQDHFKSFFFSKTIDLTRQSLQAFVEATRPALLGSLLQNVTLVGIANNPKGLESILRRGAKTITEWKGPMFFSTERKCSTEELAKVELDLQTINRRREEDAELRQTGQDVALLRKAFANLAASNKDRLLHSLSLEVVVYRDDTETRQRPIVGGGWKHIFQAATDAFKTVMPALVGSGLQVQRMNILNADDLLRCSIPSNELSTLDFDDPDIQSALKPIKSLSISLSDRIIDETDLSVARTGDPGDDIDWSVPAKKRDLDELRAEAADESNFFGLAKIVSLCSNLEELDLHYYNLAISVLTPADAKDEVVLQRLAELGKDRLHQLKKCRLRGFHVWESDLLAFVQQAPLLQDLSLENVMLTRSPEAEEEEGQEKGSFKSIIAHCTSEETNVQKLFCDDLFEHGRLVYFEVPGRPKFVTTGRSWGTNTLRWEGESSRRGIKYHFAKGRMMGSAAAYNWRERRRALYGPP